MSIDGFHITSTLTSTPEIVQGFDGHISGPTPGFFPKYFPGLDIPSSSSSSSLNENHAQIAGGIFAESLSRPPTPLTFMEWFSNFSSTPSDLSPSQGRWHSRKPVMPDQVDEPALLFMTLADASGVGNMTNPEWHQVQIIGIFSQAGSEHHREGLLRLCDAARKVFASQPTRHFLHGFYIRGPLMNLWVFDRSGMYSSASFDYTRVFGFFLRIMLRYQSMSGEELGQDGIIRHVGAESLVDIDLSTDGSGSGSGPSKKALLLEDKPIVIPEEVVGYGTTCYRAKAPGADQWRYIVKFKWRLASRDRAEEKILRLFKERNALGVISLEHFKQLGSTADLRRDLQLGPGRRFPATENDLDSYESTSEGGESFENRIYACIVTYPAGRELRTFKSTLELCQVLRDTVKAHRSLFQTAKILHRDISPWNIIITDSKNPQEPQGILIDLDAAMELSVGPRTPGEVTDTRPFMAIGVLKARYPRYRYDLESFLYVLLWTVISNGAENPPRGSKLRGWSRGDWDDLAARKTSDMDVDEFQNILGEFPSGFDSIKIAAEMIWRLLFPMVDGALWTGVDSSSEAVNALYDGIIDAFEQAISVESLEQGDFRRDEAHTS